MKKISELFIFLSLAFPCSCLREESDREIQELSELRVSVAVDGLSRSLSSANDANIVNMNVYAYRDGVLAGSVYGSGRELSMTLPLGYNYRFYALVNLGKQDPPDSESGLATWRVALPAAASYAAAGLPMASRHGTAFYAGRHSATLSLGLERLVGKVCLSIERNLSRTEFQVEGVVIKQAATDVTPFCEGSPALSVTDGDSASPADIDALNRGEEVFFYVPENSAGVLLPGNLDQWAKVPGNISGKEGLCSYMQVCGSWTTPGARADVTYRMYLGKDNCSDFNVDGNTESLLTLTLTDEGVFTASWKVEMRNLQDGRRLRFPSPTLSLAQGGGSAELSIIAEPPGLDFQLYADTGLLEDAKMSYTLDALQLQLRTAYIGTQEKTAKLFLRSWDGLLSDTLTVTVPYIDGEYTDFSYSMPRYIVQWGSFRFPRASVSSPVRFAIAGRSEQIYPGASRWTIYDYSTGLRFIYDGNTTVWSQAFDFPSGNGSPCTLSLGCGSLVRTLRLYPGVVPDFGFSEDLMLSECGNNNYDSYGSYDMELDLHLLDDNGEIINLSDFATPDALLSLWGISPSDDTRYSNLYETYGSSIWGEFSEEGYCGYSMSFYDDNFEEFLAENSLARFRLWGLKADGDEAAELSFSVVNDGLLKLYSQSFPLTVVPVFPSQRFLGEYYNMQIAPGAMRSYSTALDFTSGGHYAPSGRGISWTLADGDFSTSDKPSANMMDSRSKRCSNVSFNGRSLIFSYDRISGNALCSGAYVLYGEATNPHSGRIIRGWYTFDVILYMSVGACVGNLGDKTMGYSFVPFCEYAAPYDSDLWNDSMPVIPVAAVLEDGSRSDGSIRVPEDEEDCDFSMSLNGIYDISGHSFSYNCFYISNYTNWRSLGDFYFKVDGRETTGLDLNRSGYAATTLYGDREYVRGSKGYYRLRRQRDIANLPDAGTYGLSNYIVEAAFGSFAEL